MRLRTKRPKQRSSDLDRSTSNVKKHMALFILALIVFILIGSFIAEAALNDRINAGKTKLVSKFKDIQGKYITGQRIVNYVLLTFVLIVASLFFLKDKMSDDKTKYVIWIGCVILAIILTVNLVKAPDEYIWQKPFVQDGKNYLLGNDAGKPAGCSGDGAYFDKRMGEKGCRQGILRSNNGKGLPAFVVGVLILLLVFSKFKEQLGLGDNKKLKFGIAILLGAVIANGGTDKEFLISIGGWIVLAILFFTFKEKMPEKIPLAFGLAYACVETLLNLFGTTLFGSFDESVVTSSRIIWNFVVGIGVGVIWSSTFGKEGAMRQYWDKAQEKRKDDIEELIDDDKMGRAFMKSLPGIGMFVSKDGGEGEKLKDFIDGVREGAAGTFNWVKGKEKNLSTDETQAQWDEKLDTLKEQLTKEFDRLRNKFKGDYPQDEPNSLTAEEVFKAVDKLSHDDLSGDDASKNVRKALDKTVLENRGLNEATKADVIKDFLGPFEQMLWNAHKKKMKDNYIRILLRQKLWADKKKEEEAKTPEAVAERKESLFNLAERDKQVTEKNDAFIKSYNDKVKGELTKIIKKYKIDTAFPESIMYAELLITKIEEQLGFSHLYPEEQIDNWVKHIKVLPVWPGTISVGDPEKNRDLQKDLTKILEMLKKLITNYCGFRNGQLDAIRNTVETEWAKMRSEGYHNVKDADLVIEEQKRLLIRQLADELYAFAKNGEQPYKAPDGRQYPGIVKPGSIKRTDAEDLAEDIFNKIFSKISPATMNAVTEYVQAGLKDIFQKYIWVEGVRNEVKYDNTQKRKRNEIKEEREAEAAARMNREPKYGEKIPGWEKEQDDNSMIQDKLYATFSVPIINVATAYGEWMRETKRIRAEAEKAGHYRAASEDSTGQGETEMEQRERFDRIIELTPLSDHVFITRDSKIVDKIQLSVDLSKKSIKIGRSPDNDIVLAALNSAVGELQAEIYLGSFNTYKVKHLDKHTDTFVKKGGREEPLRYAEPETIVDASVITFGGPSSFKFVVTSAPVSQRQSWGKYIVYEVERRKDIKTESMTIGKAEDLLKVKVDYSVKKIQKAYHNAAMEWHPDRWSQKPEAEQNDATERFKEINQAYAILMDEKDKGK